MRIFSYRGGGEGSARQPLMTNSPGPPPPLNRQLACATVNYAWPTHKCRTLVDGGQGAFTPVPFEILEKKYFSGKYVNFGHLLIFIHMFSGKNVLPLTVDCSGGASSKNSPGPGKVLKIFARSLCR